MKIIFLHDNYNPENLGGASRVVNNLARGILDVGHEVSIITSTTNRFDEGEILIDGIRIYKIYSNYRPIFRSYFSLYNPLTVGKIKLLINKIKPDIVHAHNIHQHLSYHSLKIAKDSGAKVFLTAHDAMLFHYGKFVEFIGKSSYKIDPWEQMAKYKLEYNPVRNLIIRQQLKNVSKIFAVSNALKKALNQNGITNVATLYNGIDIKLWVNKNNNKNKNNSVMFVGKLSGAKGGPQIIAAMKIVKQKIPDAKLLVVGQKPVDPAILQLEKDGLIEFSGYLSGQAMVKAYYSSSLVVFPSVCLDTFGMVVLEAMACKKPVVGTCFGGAPEIIADGKTGWVVNPLDIPLLAEKIINLLVNEKQAKTFGEQGFKRVGQLFSLQSQVAKTLSWYGLPVK
ncbi:MAG: glycosyltransferase family 4 protein [Patescibacteria group bacterium]